MRLVVADTSPLNYLVLIGQVEILPALFEKVFVPQIVRNELRHDEAPERVRRWIGEPPSWLEIAAEEHVGDDPDLRHLDDGEPAAILLAVRIGAELLLIDDRDGVIAARSRGFAVTGTLGLLDLAAGRGMIRLNDAVERLKKTSFRCHPDVLNALLARHPPRPPAHPTCRLRRRAAIERSVRELAALTGETVTAAIRHAAEERLQRVRRKHAGRSLAEEILEIGRRCAALPDRETRTADEILGYDAHGLPG